MKKNALIIVGLRLMGLGWACLIYGIVLDMEASRWREQYEPNCWEFDTAGITMSGYTLGGKFC